jgi:hypothetical protein
MPESFLAAEHAVEDDVQWKDHANRRYALKCMPYRYFCSLLPHLQGVVIV